MLDVGNTQPQKTVVLLFVFCFSIKKQKTTIVFLSKPKKNIKPHAFASYKLGSGSGYLTACFAALLGPHRGKVVGSVVVVDAVRFVLDRTQNQT